MGRLAVSLIFLALVFGISSAYGEGVANSSKHSAVEARVAKKERVVREYLELGEYEMAQKSLLGSLRDLTEGGYGVGSVAAQTHLYLGLVEVVGFKNTRKATEHFRSALHIDKDIQLPKVASKRAQVVFAKVFEELYPTIDCKALMGLYHKAITLTEEGRPTVVEAYLGKRLLGHELAIVYRDTVEDDFVRLPMERGDGCVFRGIIPSNTLHAPNAEYYLEVKRQDGRAIARKGSTEVPFVLNVNFGARPDSQPVADKAQTSDTASETTPASSADEVEELLLSEPKPSKARGCAGCSHTGGTATWFLLLCTILCAYGLRSRFAA